MALQPEALTDETVIPTLWVCVTSEQWATLMLLPAFMERVEFPPRDAQREIGPPMLGRVLVERPDEFNQPMPLWLLFFEAHGVTTEALANIAAHFGGDLPRVKQIVWRPGQ